MASERTPFVARSLVVGSQSLWRAGAAFAAVGMIAGAFGAHGLKKRVDAEKLHAWETAAHYAIFNGLALLSLSLHPRFSVHRFAGPAIATGAFVFSSSIMALVFDRNKRFSFLGPITPLGGSLMIAGYISLLF